MPDTIDLTPEWEPTALYFATALAQHAFEKNAYEPVASFVEQIRHLTQTDPPAVDRLIKRLEARAEQ